MVMMRNSKTVTINSFNKMYVAVYNINSTKDIFSFTLGLFNSKKEKESQLHSDVFTIFFTR